MNGATGDVTNNTITGVQDGVFLEGANTINIDDNTFQDVSGNAIGIGQYPGVQNEANIAVTDNTFNNVGVIINGDQPGTANDSAAVVVATNSTIDGVPGATSIDGTTGNDVLRFRLNAGVTEYTKDNGVNWIAVTVGSGPLVVNGGLGDDSLIIDFTGGNPISASGLVFNGGAGGNDTLSFIGTGLAAGTLTHTNQFDGTVSLDGRTLAYTGLDPITINTPGANWVLEYATDPAPVTLAASGADLLVTRAGVAEQVTISRRSYGDRCRYCRI